MPVTDQHLKCFVASAFDRDDVDAIYDQVVLPVLASLEVSPLRVDRLEHNDDIDDKILALIGECDFCLADLTHARPSVYFESGCVSGLGKPVVYMARADHFRDRPDDPAGNLRVHFDLQMKNIIRWTQANDTLRTRLASRIRHVTRPLIAEKHRRETDELQRERFRELSVYDRDDGLSKLAHSALRSAGYVVLENRRLPGMAAFRQMDDRIEAVTVYINQSFTKRDLRLILSDNELSEVRSLIVKKAGVHLPALRAFDVICVSARPVPTSRVAEVCPSFSVAEAGSTYRETAVAARPTRVTALHTLCPTSFEAFRQMMARHCSELGRIGTGK